MQNDQLVRSEDLIRLGFEKTPITISLIDGALEYAGLVKEKVNSQGPAGVYVVIAESFDNKVHVVYVGKAGKGVHRRFSQHAAGHRRNVRKAAESANTRRMRDKFLALSVHRFDVWFRQSPQVSFAEHFGFGVEQFSISAYSLEEELLIARFFDFGLINAQLPAIRSGAVIGSDPVEETLNNAMRQSAHDLMISYRQSVERWSNNTRSAVNAILRDREAEIAPLTPRVSSYSSGPFKNQPVLVFGIWAARQFKPGSKQFMINKTGGSFVEWPFGEQEQMEITDTASYFDIG